MFSNILLFLPFGIGLFYTFREKWVRIPGMPAVITALIVGALFNSITDIISAVLGGTWELCYMEWSVVSCPSSVVSILGVLYYLNACCYNASSSQDLIALSISLARWPGNPIIPTSINPRTIAAVASSADNPRAIRYSISSWAILPTAAS